MTQSDASLILGRVPTPSPASNKGKVPIIELFGPTIQGEGIMAGTLSHFLRTGGCPLKCAWCDSMHAVDPQQVKVNAHWWSPWEIVDAVSALPYAPWVTLTGGDPCIWAELEGVIATLNVNQYRVAVETQGTHFAEWLPLVDVITFSPKPPSSENPVDIEPLVEWLTTNANQQRAFRVCIKVVVFDEQDLAYALDVFQRVPYNCYDAFYFTAGTSLYTVANSPHFRADSVLRSFRRLSNHLLGMSSVTFNEKVHVGCQQHVLLWPDKDQGV